jgi:hypothetical protein
MTLTIDFSPRPDLRPTVRISLAELHTEARLRFGDDPLNWATVCPSCGDISTVREWETTSDPYASGAACIGRYLPGRGCTRSAAGPWQVVMPSATDQAHAHRCFALAGQPAPDGPVARALGLINPNRSDSKGQPR